MILRLVNDLGTSPGERLKGDIPKSIQPYMREKLVRMKCPLNLPEEPLLSFAFPAADAVAAFRHLRVPPPESGSVGQTRRWNGQRSDRNGNPTTGDAGGEVSLRAAVLWNRQNSFNPIACLRSRSHFVSALMWCL
nr:(-)-alpha-terpineol synthase-like [Ipomoea batatas]